MAKATVSSGRALASASASRSSLPPRKKVCISSKPSSAHATLDLPNLSDCHACGSRTKGKLQTLPSQWRVVLLCHSCRCGVDSSDLCSYCFCKVSISAADGIDCHSCNRRVHRGCLSFAPPPGPFTCVDCWVPKFGAKWRVPDMTSSRISPRATKEGRGRWPVVKDVVKDVSHSVERAVAAARRARERAQSKAASAKQAAERARSAVDMALLAAKKDGCTGENSVLDDKEMAVRLHRLMNSSPRISKILGFAGLDSVDALKRRNLKGSNLDSHSMSGKLEASTTSDMLFENSNVNGVEPLAGFSAFDRNSSVEFDASRMQEGGDREMTSFGDECKHGAVESFGMGRDVDPAEKFNCEDEKSDVPMKEEQGSCSNKVVNSSEDDNSVESGSESCREQNRLKDMDSSKCSGTLCLPGDDGISSSLLQRCDGSNRYLITYSKRRARS